MTTMMRGVRGVAVLAATLAAAGCSQLGGLEQVLGGVLNPQGGAGGSGEVSAQVRYVDTQRQQIQVQAQNGQVGSVYFDQRTRVVYQNQEYPVTALEAGDEVRMRLQQDQRGTMYTDYIMVTRSVQDTGGYGGNTSGGTYNTGVQATEGRVGWVDYNRGQFELSTSRGRTVVTLPYNTAGYEADRFRRLRQGEYVRVQGRWVSQDRFELERFL